MTATQMRVSTEYTISRNLVFSKSNPKSDVHYLMKSYHVVSSPENGSSDEDSLPPSKRLKTAAPTDEAAGVSH